MKTYLIEYRALDAQNIVIKEGKIKVKNKMSQMQAKIDLEKYLIKKLPNFNKLIVLKCDEDFASVFGFWPF